MSWECEARNNPSNRRFGCTRTNLKIMKDNRVFYSYWPEKSQNCHQKDDKNTEYSKSLIDGDSLREMTIRLIEAAGLRDRLECKWSEICRRQTDPAMHAADGRNPLMTDAMKIAIKPNLVSPTPAELGATTHPEIIAGIIEYLQSLGFRNITIMEGSWVGDSTQDSFHYCGYEDLAERYGIRLLDTKKDAALAVRPEGSEQEIRVCRCALETDFLINVPVLKGHCQTRMTCALKNMKGLIPDSEKRHFHAMGLHRPIALLNRIISQDFIVVDHICGDPEFEDGGNPLVRNCVMAAYDAVAADTAACQALGIDPGDIEYLRLAADAEGGFEPLEKIILEGIPMEDVPDTHRLLDVRYMIEEVESCSACYSVLIGALDRLKKEKLLDGFDERIGIGQGCRGKCGRLGVGRCTEGYELSIPGCPPDEDDIYTALRKYLIANGKENKR